MPKSRLRKKGRKHIRQNRRSNEINGFRRFDQISSDNVIGIAKRWLYRRLGKSGYEYLKKSWGKNFSKFAVVHWEDGSLPAINAKRYFKFIKGTSILKNYFVNCTANRYLVPTTVTELQNFMQSRRDWLVDDKKAA